MARRVFNQIIATFIAMVTVIISIVAVKNIKYNIGKIDSFIKRGGVDEKQEPNFFIAVCVYIFES